MRKLMSLFLACVAVLSLAIGMGSLVSASAAITLEIDGQVIAPSVAPVVDNGTTLAPLRVISETLGAEVAWIAAQNQVVINTAAYTVVFTIDSTSFTVNGATKTLTSAPKIINGSTMVPIRAMSEAIGAGVNYDSTTNKATVTYFTNMIGSIKVSGSTTVLPIMQAAADELVAMNNNLTITVSGGGSGTGINDSLNGINNIGMSSRDLTIDEKNSLVPVKMANDGIAVIVHPNNPVTNLTSEQAKQIFLGEIKNWQDVGGKNAPILVQTRETGSGTLATLEEMLLEKQKVVGTATPFTSSALIKQAVAQSETAIGFDSVGFVDSSVKMVSIDNVTPSDSTVKDNAYVLSRSLYVVTKDIPSGINAKLIDFLCTLTVQESIVKTEGYITLH